MKTVIDKMADYVSRNGSAFEKLMRERERNNPKLQFIFEVPNPLSRHPSPTRVWLMLSTSSDLLLWWLPCASWCENRDTSSTRTTSGSWPPCSATLSRKGEPVGRLMLQPRPILTRIRCPRYLLPFRRKAFTDQAPRPRGHFAKHTHCRRQAVRSHHRNGFSLGHSSRLWTARKTQSRYRRVPHFLH